MALTCATDLSGVNLGFTEFIDCDSISINYDILGVANVSFTVVATQAEPTDTNQYTTLIFGGIEFTGHITNLEIRQVPGTLIYEHAYTLTGVGCEL